MESVYQLQLWSRDFVSRWGRDFDLLLTPTMSIEPPPAGEVLAATHQGAGTPLQVLQMVVFTSVFNMSGLPAISLPTRSPPAGCPSGSRWWPGRGKRLCSLRVSAQLEQALPWAPVAGL